MPKFTVLLNRLYISWIWFLATVGIIGFLVSGAIVVHDSAIAQNALQKAKTKFNKIDPSGKFYEEKNKIERDISWDLYIDTFKSENNIKMTSKKQSDILDQVKKAFPKCSFKDKIPVENLFNFCEKQDTLTEAGFFIVFNDYPERKFNIYLNDNWGDNDFANITYLWMCSLWLAISLSTMLFSYLFRKWLIFLFRQGNNTNKEYGDL